MFGCRLVDVNVITANTITAGVAAQSMHFGPQIFCLHGGLSPTLDTLDHIRALDRVQEVRSGHLQGTPAAQSPVFNLVS